MKNFVLPVKAFSGSKEDLNKVRSTQIAILKTFVKYCDEFTINYFLFGDALKGAVQNKDFLADKEGIDILMTRPDYEKFVSCFIKVPIMGMTLDSMANSDTWLAPYSVLTKAGTEMAGSGKYEKGISINILPLDGMPNGDFAQKRRINKVNRLLAILNIKKMAEIEPDATFLRKVQLLALKVYSIIKSERKWKLAYEAEIKRCSYKYSTVVVCLSDCIQANIVSKDKFVKDGQVGKVSFGGISCTIPFAYDEVIKAYDAVDVKVSSSATQSVSAEKKNKAQKAKEAEYTLNVPEEEQVTEATQDKQ